MSVNLTPAQARKLGIDVPGAKVKTTNRVATGAPYHTRCRACDEEFLVQAAEDRHVMATSHVRYELVLT